MRDGEKMGHPAEEAGWKENLRADCPCRKKNCPRFGDCAACEEHHRMDRRYPVPYCRKKPTDRRRK